MGNDWNAIKLKDFVIVNPPERITNGDKAKKIPMDSLNPFTKKIESYSFESFKSGTKFRNGDTLLARITPCLENGKTAYVDILDENEIGFGSTEYIVLREKQGVSDKFFIYYLATSPFLRNIAIQSMTGSSGRQRVQTDVLINETFKLPPLPEQKAIAHILGSLDDKIELNRQTNKTLEQIAQALYKSWFVDFDPVIDNALEAGNTIPGELINRAKKRKELGEHRRPLPDNIKNLFPSEFEFCDELDKWIPRGWELQTLDENIQLIGGGTPKTTVEEYWNGDIPWFSVVDAPNDSDVFVIDTEKKITNQGLQKSSTKLLRKGTTIITARGTVGKCALVGISMAMNQSCYGINSIQDGTDIYTYYVIRESVSALQLRGHGSVFNTITRDTFKSIRIPISDIELRKEFDLLASPYLNRIKQNLYQIQILVKIRDTLLPKLISGELPVSDKVFVY